MKHFLLTILFFSLSVAQSQTVKWGESAFGMTFTKNYKVLYKGKMVFEGHKWNGRGIYEINVTLSPKKKFISAIFSGNDGVHNDMIFDIEKNSFHFHFQSTTKNHHWSQDDQFLIVAQGYEGARLTLFNPKENEVLAKYQLTTDSLIYFPEEKVIWKKDEIRIEATGVYNPYERMNATGTSRWSESKSWLFELIINMKTYALEIEFIKEVKK